MARARNIKPGFFQNDDLAALPALDRLTFIGLWTLADRAGRLGDKPFRIAGLLFPFEAAPVDMDQILMRLNDAGFIKRYEVEGQKLIWIPNFEKHQSPHRNEVASSLPPWHEGLSTKDTSASDQGAYDFALNEERGILNEECGKLNDERGNISSKADVAPPRKHRIKQHQEIDQAFMSWWATYPRRVGKVAAETSYAKAVKAIQATGKTKAEAEAWLLTRTKAFAASDKARGEFCPHPATWLNQGRYDDDDAAWQDNHQAEPVKVRPAVHIPGRF